MPTLDDNPLDEVEGDDIQDGSSDELVDTLQHTPDLSIVSRQDLIAMVKESQLNNQALARSLRDLKTRIGTGTQAPGGSPSGTGSCELTVSSEERDISRAGGRFAFAYELWFDRDVLDKERPTGIDTQCPRRFDDPDRQKLTALAELYESLSPTLQSALTSPLRSQSFKDILNQERSNMVSTARRVAPGLLGLDPQLLRTRANRLDVPEIQALLQNPKKPGEMYPIFAPILFPGKDCNNLVKVFQAWPLAGLLRAILFGESSLDGVPTGKRASKATIWRISEIAPGMIAMAATIMTFVCGPDQIFSEKLKGPSGIEWGKRFLQYKCTILRLPPHRRSELYTWYNKEVFKKPSPSATVTESESGVDDIDELIHRLEDTDVEQPASEYADSTQDDTPLVPLEPEPTALVNETIVDMAEDNIAPIGKRNAKGRGGAGHRTRSRRGGKSTS
ncbi:hypothetical protein BC826DRAFT_1106339 [Russula brevipes]|nr:hypothetical protein BC826DRAFT_970462 [Russula brevipes]KAI0290735.1 hypothetical protein BC826DRAFT_1106339 [Russula brevipes]